ncbi:MAG: DHHA1 domain-containing protein, partial [Anaerolineaceae bacterium]|nr:DHHA1 domain-containing protein [Anaerolineaceae bacterium]
TLGEHVVQKGSLVNSERLRFDFAHFEPVSESELNTIEQLVNDHIRLNDPVIAEVMDKESAMQEGAMALFGEKYGEEVRVLKIGDFSVELCGGTHVNRSGDIGLFKIVSETGVAAGIRRIEAVTGKAAMDWLDSREKTLSLIAGLMKAPQDKAYEKVEQLVEKYKQLEKELEKLKSKLASSAGTELSSQAIDINGVKVLAVRLDGIDPKSMREMVDQLRNKLGSSAVVLATVAEGKVSLIAGVSPDQTSRIKAGDLVNQVASKVGGKGGGRPDMAQAGGNDPTHLDEALSAIPKWVEQQLSS